MILYVYMGVWIGVYMGSLITLKPFVTEIPVGGDTYKIPEEDIKK